MELTLFSYFLLISFLLLSSGVPSTSAARGNDLKCRPFRKKNFSAGKNVNPQAKISDDFFLVIHPKNENFCYRLCRPLCRPLVWPVPPLIFISFVRFYRKFYLFNVNLTIFPKSAVPRYATAFKRPCSRPVWCLLCTDSCLSFSLVFL